MSIGITIRVYAPYGTKQELMFLRMDFAIMQNGGMMPDKLIMFLFVLEQFRVNY